jgi:glucokinase
MKDRIIGVDLGGTNLRAALLSGGEILRLERAALVQKDSQDATLRQITGLIRPLCSERVRGIGIGVPSVVDPEKGIVYNVTNIPSWVKVPLGDLLREEFGLPVYVNNDVNCFILGEHRYGRARAYRSVVGMAAGTGLGGGLILDGRLYHGRNCGAGEIGLMPYRDRNIEYYCSGNFFSALHGTTARAAHEAALAGDPEARRLWELFGGHFGWAVQAVTYAYDPEAIVIGGSLAKAYPLFEAAMRATFAHFEFPESIKSLDIYPSDNENINLLGAASLVPE